MSAAPHAAPAIEPASAEAWRVAAERAPGIGWGARIRQLAWTVLIGVGSLPLLAIAKISLADLYWLGLLDTGFHLALMACAWFGTVRDWRTIAPDEDLLLNRAARVRRFTLLRRLLMVEAGVLVAYAPLKTLWSGAQLQWGWPATLAVSALLITWSLERIARVEWREHRRLLDVSPHEGP